MPNNEKKAALKRIEAVLAEANPERPIRSTLIATLLAKKFTVQTAVKIAEEKMLRCGVRDMNLALAIHYGLKYSDLELVNPESHLDAVIKRLDDDIPRTLLDRAIRSALLEARALVGEISRALDSDDRPLPEQSIGDLFPQRSRQRAKAMLKKSYHCLMFPYGISIEFTRRDGSKTTLAAELAISPKELDTGFAKRPYVPFNTGMWYDLGEDQVAGFVTRDTVRPFSVAYISSQGRITEIVERKANDSQRYLNKVPVRYVLEVPSPWFAKNGIHEEDTAEPLSIIAWM